MEFIKVILNLENSGFIENEIPELKYENFYFSSFNNEPNFCFFKFIDKNEFAQKLYGQALRKTKEYGSDIKLLDKNNDTKLTFSLLECQDIHNKFLNDVFNRSSNGDAFSCIEEFPIYNIFLNSNSFDFISNFLISSIALITDNYETFIKNIELLISKTNHGNVKNNLIKVKKIMNIKKRNSDINITIIYSPDNNAIVHFEVLKRTLELYKILFNRLTYNIVNTTNINKESLDTIIEFNKNGYLFLVGHGSENGLFIRTSDKEFFIDKNYINILFKNTNYHKTDTQLFAIFCCDAENLYSFPDLPNINIVHTEGKITFDTVDTFLLGFIQAISRTPKIKEVFYIATYAMAASSRNYHLVKLH